MKLTVFDRIRQSVLAGEKQFWILLDPDRESPTQLNIAAEMAIANGADGILVGSSSLENSDFQESVLAVKEGCEGTTPVILFPGSHRQVSEHADAMLFHALLSSRDSKYLVEEQYLASSIIRQIGLETIPTGYILIESGCITSVQRKTGSTPLSRNDPIAIAQHALTGQYLGKQLIYLEAGSGARYTVPAEVIELAKETIDIPLVVGGGIKTPELASVAVRAGADFVVVGNALEKNRQPNYIRELADAVHSFAGIST